MAKTYPISVKRHGVPEVKTTKNRSGSPVTSSSVRSAFSAGKSTANWNAKGQPTLKKPSVPGYNYPSGTPKYIEQAASAAERKASSGGFDCGYGKQDVHRSHRMSLGGPGKPDVAKDQSYRNPVKETK